MSTVIVMTGLPGSGKDTWINNFLKTERGSTYNVVSTDMYLEEIAKEEGLTYNDVFEDRFKDAERRMNAAIQGFVAAGVDVIWNQTNLGLKKRAKILNIFKKYKNKFSISIIIDPVEHRKRLDARAVSEGKTISESVIRKMILDRVEPSLDEGFHSLMVLDTSGDTPSLVSFVQSHLDFTEDVPELILLNEAK